jgi:hypothetical protein
VATGRRLGLGFRVFWAIMSLFLLHPVLLISFEFPYFALDISVRA